jgi:copper chaperone CopZ
MKTIFTYIGTALAALAASACCWIPALLGTGAAGSLGASAALAPWRPYLLSLTALFLAAGFYLAYRKPKAAWATDCCSTGAAVRRRRVNILVMWGVAVFAVAMAAYPEVQAVRLNAAHATQAAPAKAEGREVVLAVKGMDCAGCAAQIEENLQKVPGVLSGHVEYEKGRAVVRSQKTAPVDAALIEAVQKSGFEATIQRSQ